MLVAAGRAVRATTAVIGRAAIYAAASVTVTMNIIRRIGATIAVIGRSAVNTVPPITEMFVVPCRAVRATVSVVGRPAMNTFTHWF